MTCKDCKNGHIRSPFSYKKNGNYAYNYECCLKENEKTPYRRADDSCEKMVKR
jgi:hypothetical protein